MYIRAKCDLCGCKEYQIAFIEDEFKLVKCNNCGFIYTRNPPKEIFELEGDPEDIFRETQRDKGYLYKYILKLIGKENGKLLDVGCRTGNFMIEARKQGFEPIGIEVSRKFARFTQNLGFTVFNSTLKEVGFPDRSFDIITYNAVLEHITSPSEELREVYRVLKDRGLLVLEIPDFNFHFIEANFFKLLGKKHGLIPYSHISYFPGNVIVNILSKVGFETLKIRKELQLREKFLILGYLLKILRIGNIRIILAQKEK